MERKAVYLGSFRTINWAALRCFRTRAPAGRTHQIKTHLSELLDKQAWRATGLGAPTDVDRLQQRIVTLEQQLVERLQLEQRDQELAARQLRARPPAKRAARRSATSRQPSMPPRAATCPRKR